MRIAALKKYEGQVVVLDLVMGREITTLIQSVNEDEKTVMCRKPRIFMPVPDPKNPNNLSVMALEYGHPMYKADDLMEIDAGHVVTVFIPEKEQKDAYTRHTSGVVMAPAGALGQLPQIDPSKFQK